MFVYRAFKTYDMGKDGRIESYFRRIEQFQYDDIMSAARILESLISTCFPFNEAKPHIKTIMDELRFKTILN